MNTTWILATAAIGIALGSFYFVGLWLTVRRMAIARQPALLFFGSFLVRTGVVLISFYLLTAGGWEGLAACMAGFLVARTAFIRRLRYAEGPDLAACPETQTRKQDEHLRPEPR